MSIFHHILHRIYIFGERNGESVSYVIGLWIDQWECFIRDLSRDTQRNTVKDTERHRDSRHTQRGTEHTRSEPMDGWRRRCEKQDKMALMRTFPAWWHPCMTVLTPILIRSRLAHLALSPFGRISKLSYLQFPTYLVTGMMERFLRVWETKKTRVSYQLVLCFDFWLNRSQQEEDDVLLVALLSAVLPGCGTTGTGNWGLGLCHRATRNWNLIGLASGIISLFRKLDGTEPVFLTLNCLCLASCQAGHMHG